MGAGAAHHRHHDAKRSGAPPGRATQNEKELEFLLELEACQQTLARLGERLRGIVPVEGVWNHLLMLVRD